MLRSAGRYATAGMLSLATLAYGQQPVQNSGTNGWPTATQGDSATQNGGTAQNEGPAQNGGPQVQSDEPTSQQPTGPQVNQLPQGSQQGQVEQPPYDAPQPSSRRPMPPPSGQYGPPASTGQYGPPPGNGYPPPDYRQQPPAPIPAQLTVTPGSFITVRVNQRLASDRNQIGDTFTATLVQPVVANGVVVAEPGETLGGVVADAEKGGTQKLVVQLTDLTLIDGQRVPLQTQLIARHGTGRTGEDAGTIIGTTALGAAVGSVIDWGTGAAVGAGAGLVVGALVTHNHPSVLYPEQVLTFRLQTPVAVSTVNAPQAFHYIEPGEYDRTPYNSGGPQLERRPSVYAAGYPWWGDPFWSPGIGFYAWGGPGYGYYPGRFYGGRGYYRGFSGVRGGYARAGGGRR